MLDKPSQGANQGKRILNFVVCRPSLTSEVYKWRIKHRKHFLSIFQALRIRALIAPSAISSLTFLLSPSALPSAALKLGKTSSYSAMPSGIGSNHFLNYQAASLLTTLSAVSLLALTLRSFSKLSSIGFAASPD